MTAPSSSRSRACQHDEAPGLHVMMVGRVRRGLQNVFHLRRVGMLIGHFADAAPLLNGFKCTHYYYSSDGNMLSSQAFSGKATCPFWYLCVSRESKLLSIPMDGNNCACACVVSGRPQSLMKPSAAL